MNRRHCLASLATTIAPLAWGASPESASAASGSGTGDGTSRATAGAPAREARPAAPVLPHPSNAQTVIAPGRAARAAAALRDIEARTGGRLGVQLTDAAGVALLSHRADERFAMCSTFKALAAGAVLLRVDKGEESLKRRVAYTKSDLLEYAPETRKHVGYGMTLGELCQAAVEFSDNTAANLILASLGGPAGVTQVARRLGDTVTRLDRNEPSLNEAEPGDERDTTSPAAMAGDLRQLLLSPTLLSMNGRQWLQRWMRACKTGDDTLRAGFPPNSLVMNKTGTGNRGTRNDVGVVWLPGGPPRAMAVYLTGATVGRPEQSAAIADVARAVAAMLAT